MNNKIQLRSDAVNTAVCSLIQRASSPRYRTSTGSASIPSSTSLRPCHPDRQYGDPEHRGAVQFVLSARLHQPSRYRCDAALLQLRSDDGHGQRGTHFEVALPQMKTIVSYFGDGSSSAKPKPFIFLITDGMQNSQHFSALLSAKYAYPGSPSKFLGYLPAAWDGSQPAQIDPSNCASLKNAGAVISILYIPYNQLFSRTTVAALPGRTTASTRSARPCRRP